MSGIYGALGLNAADNQRAFVNVIGQELVFEAANIFLAQWSEGLRLALSVFVEQETEIFKERYMLPGGGRLQELGRQAPSGAVKASGKYDVAYPLTPYGASLGYNRQSMAYLTLGEFDRHLDTITLQAAATTRHELLKAILNNTQRTFIDPIHGSLSIEPGANGDAVVYPPVIGSEDEATEDHYLESGYAATNISDTNNPYETIADDLNHHYGETGTEDVMVWINSAEKAKTRDLTDFDSVAERFIEPGDDVSIARPIDAGPGKPLGVCSDCMVKVWSWIPANYMVAMSLSQPALLKQRNHPSDVGLPSGLSLVQTDQRYPLTNSSYELSFGFGAGNRLNIVVMELGTGGSYTIPSGYS